MVNAQRQRFRIGADVDDIWQTVQPGPNNEQQVQRITLQFCQVTLEVTDWIGCSRLRESADGSLTLGSAQVS